MPHPRSTAPWFRRPRTSPLDVAPFDDPPFRVVAGLLGVVALSAIDGTVLATAMPRVVESIGGLGWHAWVFASFMLANTLATPVFGRYADRRGVRPCLWAALALFLLGCALAGAATDMPHLVAYRAVQGAGVGGMVTAASAAFGLLYLPERRARAQGWVALVWGVASLAGPLAGGLLVTYLPWPWLFWLNVPVGLALAPLVGKGLPAPVPRPEQAVPNVRFTPLRRNPTFVVGLLLGALSCATIYPAINDLPLYLQGVLDRPAPEAGLALTPMLVAWPVAAWAAAPWMNRCGFRPLVVGGAALMVAGYALLAWPAMGAGAWLLAAPGFLIGAGMGLTSSTVLVANQTSVPQHRLGAASAWLGVARNLGGALGLGVLGFCQLQTLPAGLDPAARGALAASLHTLFAAAAAVSLVCLAAACLMPRENPLEAARRGTQPLT